jgi:hypothetical protein
MRQSELLKSAPSFVRVSFTPGKRQQNAAEYPTLPWKSQFVQAVGYGWICRSGLQRRANSPAPHCASFPRYHRKEAQCGLCGSSFQVIDLGRLQHRH